MLKFIKILILSSLLFLVGGIQHKIYAQSCGATARIDQYWCVPRTDSNTGVQFCEPGTNAGNQFSCNTTTCKTNQEVCSSNDLSKCTMANGCNINPCSLGNCALDGPADQGFGCQITSGTPGQGNYSCGGDCGVNQTCRKNAAGTDCVCKSNPIPPTNNPFGNHDLADCTWTAGWACDGDDYASPLLVHLYVDGPAGTGTYLGATLANVSRPDVAPLCGGVGTHGFGYTIPESLKTNTNRTIYAYGINIGGTGTTQLLPSSPKTINCPPSCTPTPPTFSVSASYTPSGNVTGTTQTLLWSAVTSWGTACNSGSNQYLVYLSTSPTNITSTTPIYTGTGTTTQFTTGVPGTTYYWVVVATNGQQSVTSPTNSFSIQNKTITGTVYYDPNNICSGSGWSTGGVSVSLDGGAGTAVSGAGAFSFTVNDSASHTLGTSIPSNMTCSSCSTCFRGGIFSPSSNLFYLTDSRSAWWQVEGAPVYSGSTAGGTTIRSELPTASTPLILPGTGGTSGALLRASGISPDLGSGVVSDDLWNTIAKYRGKKMDYAYFAANMGLLSTTPQLNNTGAKPTSGSDFYFKSADYNVNSVWNVSGSESYVVFVNGDLNVNANTTVAPGGFLAYIVSGDINIASSVTQLEGIFLSSGSFNTITVDPTHTIDDVALSIEGSVIAWGSVNFNRDINTLNVTTPAEKVTYRTDLLENMPDNMKIFAMEWSEVVSGTLAD